MSTRLRMFTGSEYHLGEFSLFRHQELTPTKEKKKTKREAIKELERVEYKKAVDFIVKALTIITKEQYIKKEIFAQDIMILTPCQKAQLICHCCNNKDFVLYQ